MSERLFTKDDLDEARKQGHWSGYTLGTTIMAVLHVIWRAATQ